MGKLLQFRSLKHGEPAKFRVLAEDLRRERSRTAISWPAFVILVAVASTLIFAAVVMAGDYPFAGF